jgi:hypothetical protein
MSVFKIAAPFVERDEGTRVPELDYRSTGKDQSFQTG